MSQSSRFVMLGGFLGAGKTTTISRLAKYFREQGKRLAIVTNDQATDLVDTNLLRSQGFDVGEVAGSCFCCNFNELTETVERLGASQRPDLILAEPVGSCTDLVATVIRPLQRLYSRPLEIAPYGVILKPSHGGKILRRSGHGGFSPQAEYIFRKQLEEADFIVLNRIDELTLSEANELCGLIREQFANKPVIRTSAKTGEGFESLLATVEQPGSPSRQLIDIDYDIYAQGEAELGWLNCQASIESGDPFSLDELLIRILERLKRSFSAAGAETAHLKAIGLHADKFAVANLISNDSEPVLSLPSLLITQSADLVINARVAINPESLSVWVSESIAAESEAILGRSSIRTLQSFSPGRPVPTHRLDD